MKQQHKPGCMANMSCLAYHTDGICHGPYGVCNCGVDSPPIPASNPCCKECFLPERDGPTFYSHAAGYALPEGCKDEECECHKESPAAVEKDIQKNLRLMNHGIIYQQPEKEWWVDEIYREAFDAEQASGFVRLIRRIAAQSEKKGRETQEKYQELILAVGSIHPNETRHETALRYIQQAEEGSSVAARSSEEGKTNNK